MKECKSLICMNLVLCMVLGMFSPVAVYAENLPIPETFVEIEEEIDHEESTIDEDFKDETPEDESDSITLLSSNAVTSGACGVNLTWTLNKAGTLTISGSGDMQAFAKPEDTPWIRQNIVKVIVKEGISDISDYAFWNCISLQEISLPDSLVRIGKSAFEHCSNLKTVSIPKNVAVIGNAAFANCRDMDFIAVDAANVDYCSWNGILFSKDMKELYQCPAGMRGELVIPSGVETINDSAFSWCTELNGELVIPNSVKTIGNNAFYNCSGFSSLFLSEALVSIGDDAFYSCTELEGELVLPSGLKTIGDRAFCLCIGLEDDLTIPVGTTAIGEGAFCYCYNLTNVSVPATVRSISRQAFAYCAELETIEVVSTNEFYSSVDGVLYNKEQTLLIQCPGGKECALRIPETVTTIGETSFVGCYNLKEILIPVSVTCIERAAFYNCNSLEAVLYDGSESEWEKIQIDDDNAPISNKQGTMRLLEKTDYYRKETSISDIVGVLIPLESYSKDAQRRYYEYASDANLVGWSNGTTVYKPTDSVALTHGDVLTAQWKVKTFSIDGNSYPINKDAAGTGWHYADNRLTLEGYTGGGIVLPNGVWLYAEGTNTISGSIVTAERNASLVTNEELIIHILNGHTTITNADAASDGDPLLLDSAFIQITVEEDAVLDLCGQGTIAAPSDRITLVCHGLASLTTSGACALDVGKRTSAVYLSGAGSVVIQANEYAISSSKVPQLGYSFDIYLDPDAVEPAGGYVKGSYLRLEARKWGIQLDANGGVWTDGKEDLRTAQQGVDASIELKKYANLLSRPGYVLIGWSDEDNTVDFAVNDAVADNYEDIILYAVWKKDALQVDGKILPIMEDASGSGWSFTPSKEDQPAIISISSDYSGKPIVYTHDLIINIEGAVELVGTVGACAIDVLGDLNLNIGEGSIKIIGGNGEHAIHAIGDIVFHNDGCTSIEGGSGGHGIYGYNVTVSNNGMITIVGGLRSSAICADNIVRLGEVNGVINLLAGQNTSNAVAGSGYDCVGSLRFYCGQNASSLIRKSAFRYTRTYPYARIQPKLVVITMDANGGTIEGSVVATLSLLQAEDNSFTMQNGVQPIRSGYVFNGWNTAADGSGKSYIAGQSYIAEEDAEIQMFAMWRELETLTGSFEGKDNSLIVTIPAEFTHNASVLAACYNKDGQMLDMAFGTQNDAMWSFEIQNDEDAYTWMVFFVDNTHAPKQGNMPLSISK